MGCTGPHMEGERGGGARVCALRHDNAPCIPHLPTNTLLLQPVPLLHPTHPPLAFAAHPRTCIVLCPPLVRTGDLRIPERVR